jgi:hypothetical protein
MQHIEDIRLLTQTLLKSSQFHALVIQSAPGWGKSTTIENVLNSEKIPYLSLGSYSTPLFLYNAICSNPDSLIVLDDCAGLFQDTVAMSILKAATWKSSGSSDSRKIAWGSTSEKVEIESVVFTGKFILLTNNPIKSLEAKAFLSRVLHLSIALSTEEKAMLLKNASEIPEAFPNTMTASSVATFLSERIFSGVDNINFRTLKLGYELAISHPDCWQRLLGLLLDQPLPSPNNSSLIIFDEKSKVEDQFKIFNQQTSLSRRTFFNYRKRMLEGKPLPLSAKVQGALLGA